MEAHSYTIYTEQSCNDARHYMHIFDGTENSKCSELTCTYHPGQCRILCNFRGGNYELNGQ